jgi:hypothetical protein
LNQGGDISAGTNVTVNGGVLNFNGHTTGIGDLTITGGGQVFATAINNNTITVASGTLTAVSIVCDTLTIGSSTGAAASAATMVEPAIEVPQSAASNLPVSTTDKMEAITSPRNDDSAREELSIASTAEIAAALVEPNFAAPFKTGVPTNASDVSPQLCQAAAVQQIVSIAQLSEQLEFRGNESAQRPHLKPGIGAMNAGLYLTSRFNNQTAHVFSSQSPAIDRLKDLDYVELTDSLAKAGKQSPPALSGDRSVHGLALQSIVREFQQNIDAGEEDSELLAGKRLRKRDQLAKTAVDDFHLQLVASN